MMMMRRVLDGFLLFVCICVIVTLVVDARPLPRDHSSKRVRPWMCLERCNNTATQIQQHLQQIADNLDVITGVSFEIFNLGPNGQLIQNDLTDVHSQLQKLGVETFAMVSSYPYPPQFIDYMRTVFKNPDPFVQTTIQRGKELSITGYNCDFEPIGNITTQDAADYATFLDYWANALHEEGLELTVDVASWSVMWDFKAIGNTAIDTVMTMSTYTNQDDSWNKALQYAIDNIPLKKLGIGLENDQFLNMTKTQMQQRFDALNQVDVTEVDIWLMPLSEDLLDALRTWVTSNNN